MKLPAVAIAAAFACGILLGLFQSPQSPHDLRPLLFGAFAVAGTACVTTILCIRFFPNWGAGACSMCIWLALGMAAGLLANKPLPREHVLQRISANELDLKTPLRWHGTLRDEPTRLPWGYALDLELSGVDLAGSQVPLSGGMRVGFTPKENEPALPELHAGDAVTVIAQARLPLVYRDAGAFDRRDFLARQEIHVQATLRASSLLEKTASAPVSASTRLAKLRMLLSDRLDRMFPESPQTAGILRAMLLGDRSFLDRSESLDYQKTGVFHVLVLAGLHIAALAVFLHWLARKLRLPGWATAAFVLGCLFAYLSVVQQRPPVLRAGLMTAVVLIGSFFFRRLELLNAAGIAALVLLVNEPREILDTSFQLSFLAIGCIAAIAVPWMRNHTGPLSRSLRAWRDVTRDVMFSPRIVQFRLDLRDMAKGAARLAPTRYVEAVQNVFIRVCGGTLRLAELFALSLVLQVGMAPMMARDFHRVTLTGPLANMVVVPLTALIVPLGFLGLGTSLLIPAVGKLFAIPLFQLIRLQTFLVALFSRIPRGNFRVPGPPAWLIFAFFTVGVVLAVSLRSERKWMVHLARLSVFSLVCLSILIVAPPFPITAERGALEVTLLDVAQGDSILVISPRGSTLLLDGGGAFAGFRGREEHLGPDPGEDAVSAYLWSRGIQRLDAVTLTHAHQDHIGGLTAIMNNFRVKRLIIGRESAAPAQAELEKLASQMHVPLEHERKGQSFDWDGVRVTILWPEIAPEEIAPAAKNNDSLIMRLEYGQRSFLLPGDAEKQVEYTMLSENGAGTLRADVLKVGHHGSKNSTTPEFLAAVDPQIAIISAGAENPYGHPSPELLERLEKSGSRVLRTDRDGAIQILTNGRDLRVSCFIACPEPLPELGSVHSPDHDKRDQEQ